MPQSLQSEEVVVLAIRHFLQSSRDEERADLLTTLATATSRLSLTNLDAWERLIRAELWAAGQTRQTARWKFWETPDRPISWLDLCSADGFTRERALKALPEIVPNGFFFSLALRRLNDWVPQVRSAAREHISIIATQSQPGHVVDGLWSTLPYFTSWGRMTPEDQEVFMSLISIEQVALSLKARIVEAVVGPSSAVLAHAGRTPALDPWLSEIASNAIQPSVRAKAYRALLEHRMVWTAGRKWAWTDLKWCKGRFEPVLGERPISVDTPFLDVLRAVLVDSSPIVRRLAGEFLIKHIDSIGADSILLAKALASDPSPYVSERGGFALSKLGV